MSSGQTNRQTDTAENNTSIFGGGDSSLVEVTITRAIAVTLQALVNNDADRIYTVTVLNVKINSCHYGTQPHNHVRH